MLSIFSCVSHLYVFFGEMSKSFSHFLIGLFFWHWVAWAACIFWKLILCQLLCLKLYSPLLSEGCLLILLVSFAVHLSNNTQTPYFPECPLAHEGSLSISSTCRNPSRAFSVQRHNLPSASPSPSSGTLLLSAVRSLVSCAPWISSLSYSLLLVELILS